MQAHVQLFTGYMSVNDCVGTQALRTALDRFEEGKAVRR